MKYLITGFLIGIIAAYTMLTYNQPEVPSIVRDAPEIEFIAPVTEPVDVYIAPPRFSAEEVMCLQENIFFEAATEDEIGQKAVASVTLNRVQSSKFPDTICGVVREAVLNNRGSPIRHQCQFSWYCDGLSDEPDLDNGYVNNKWDEIGELAENMTNGGREDTVNGSVFYHTTKVSPDWDYDKIVVHATVGAHIFYTAAN
jgi:N-acetylmuramoyl-L-alanine amidase